MHVRPNRWRPLPTLLLVVCAILLGAVTARADAAPARADAAPAHAAAAATSSAAIR